MWQWPCVIEIIVTPWGIAAAQKFHLTYYKLIRLLLLLPLTHTVSWSSPVYSHFKFSFAPQGGWTLATLSMCSFFFVLSCSQPNKWKWLISILFREEGGTFGRNGELSSVRLSFDIAVWMLKWQQFHQNSILWWIRQLAEKRDERMIKLFKSKCRVWCFSCWFSLHIYVALWWLYCLNLAVLAHHTGDTFSWIQKCSNTAEFSCNHKKGAKQCRWWEQSGADRWYPPVGMFSTGKRHRLLSQDTWK